MKRGSCVPRFVSACGVALFLVSPCGLSADDEEREGTREQVEAEDNVTLHVTDGVAKDGEKELIVFDKDKPDEEWEVGVRVKFHPIPEQEYIIQSKKYNWKVSEGFVVDDPEAARPKIRAKAEASGTEGRLNLHLQWQEEKLDGKNQPTGKTKMHPWSNDKGSMRLLVPEFELESVSYNLEDGGKNGALPFYDNGDPEKKGGDATDKPRLIAAPEYVKDDTRPADNIGVLYKKGMTPKMKAKFTIRPATAGDIVLYADQTKEGIIPSACSDEDNKLSGTAKETMITCVAALPNDIRSGIAEHKWRWSVYGRELSPRVKGENGSDSIQSTVPNTFIVLNAPNECNQQTWINCMKYGVERLNAAGAANEFNLLQKIVPAFKGSVQYPTDDGEPSGKSQLVSTNTSTPLKDAVWVYDSFVNISSLYRSFDSNTKVSVNCSDSAVSIFAVAQFLGAQTNSVVHKKPWRYRISEINGVREYKSTSHTYNLYDKSKVFDATPAWGSDSGEINGPQQQGALTEEQFFVTPPWYLHPHPKYRKPGVPRIPRENLIW